MILCCLVGVINDDDDDIDSALRIQKRMMRPTERLHHSVQSHSALGRYMPMWRIGAIMRRIYVPAAYSSAHGMATKTPHRFT